MNYEKQNTGVNTIKEGFTDESCGTHACTRSLPEKDFIRGRKIVNSGEANYQQGKFSMVKN